MKKFILLAGIALLCSQVNAIAQRLCGAEILKHALTVRNPSFAQQLEEQRKSLQGIADAYKLRIKMAALGKETGTSQSAIPVIFHFIIDSDQLNEIGGTAGIVERIDSQIVVLNHDYNRENADSTLIPTGFKPLYTSVGIHFGLAHTSPTGDSTPGYELKITSLSGFSGVNQSYTDAKNVATGGLNSWDVTKYMNIWCIAYTDEPNLLGITLPFSYAPDFGLPTTDVGICVRYNAVGKRRLYTDSYPSGIDLGRTLTHECGHFFEIWHVWGDDGGLCPWNGGSDDGIADTPPQADATYGNPTLPDMDACQDSGTVDVQPYGIMCMNYMDYVNDDAMHLFTIDQAAVMASQVAAGGESHSLTQNPSLLLYPGQPASVALGNSENIFVIAPNPTTGIVHVIFNESKNDLLQISVLNILGQEVVRQMDGLNQNNITLNLSGMSRGMYFVKCTFASGSITKKILLQ